VQHKRERESSSRATKERRRERERRVQPAALLPYAAAAQCGNVRWELSECDPPPCVVFFLYL